HSPTAGAGLHPDPTSLLGSASRVELRDVYARAWFVVFPLFPSFRDTGLRARSLCHRCPADHRRRCQMSTYKDRRVSAMADPALISNLGLILHYFHIGAALVTSLTELLLLGLGIWMIPNRLLPVGNLRVALKAAIADAIVAGVLVPLGQLSIFVLLSFGAVIY